MTPAADERRWLRRFCQSPQAAWRLVCFPHVGGSAGYYHPLATALAPYAEVLAIQYPGRGDRWRERCVSTIPALADQAFAALRGQVEPPFALFGHSMGALVAFEVAARFAQGAAAGPSWLFVSGRRAPSVPRSEPVSLGDDATLIAELRHLGGTAERLLEDEDMLAAILPVIRADYQAVQSYVPQPGARVSVPVTALVGDRDPLTSPAEARAWAAHSSCRFECRVFRGGHFFLEEHRAEVAALMSRSLSGAPRSAC
jgi:pyochelin biosynthetic protein PchC